MTKSTDRNSLNAIMKCLSAFRQETLSLPEGSQIGPVLEAIEVYEQELGNFTGPELIRWSRRAMYDVQHELVSVKYGYDSDEAADAEAAIESNERFIEIDSSPSAE
jgi:hypothetical protein